LCSEDQNAGYPMHVGCHVEIFERAVGGFLSAKLRMEFEQSCKKRQLLIGGQECTKVGFNLLKL